MIIDLVCWVWLKLLRVCVWHTGLYDCVCVCHGECVFLVVSSCFWLFNIILCFSLSTNLPLGHVTTPFLASVTQQVDVEVFESTPG